MATNISDQIDRIKNNISDSLDVISAYGIDVSGKTSDHLADLIGQIKDKYVKRSKQTQIGSATKPIYVSASGETVECNSYPTSLPANGGTANSSNYLKN